jgi:hypothetical protein
MHISNKSDVADQILSYVAERPGAEDTLEGIIDWWLLTQTINIQTAIVKEALSDLVGRGLMFQEPGPDTQVRYRVNQEKLTEIRSLIRRI